jgi:uncharacterized protein YndB with AHSA1/START domain
MSYSPDPERDLSLSRIIRAPRAAVWRAWTDPARFAQWWVPAPARCRVVEMDVRPGGALVTLLSEDGGDFVPHVSGCFVEVVDGERLVFTDALVGGWRPSGSPFVTSIIPFRDHPEGTEYTAHALHESRARRDSHEEMGFHEGWGTVAAQLARLVEQPR